MSSLRAGHTKSRLGNVANSHYRGGLANKKKAAQPSILCATCSARGLCCSIIVNSTYVSKNKSDFMPRGLSAHDSPSSRRLNPLALSPLIHQLLHMTLLLFQYRSDLFSRMSRIILVKITASRNNIFLSSGDSAM
jgi:hypothetical protein